MGFVVWYNELMATRVYTIQKIILIDGRELELGPLKIKYLRDFMDCFYRINESSTEEDAISVLVECARIAMQQYCPEISTSTDLIEENMDLPTVYKVLDIAGGIEVSSKSEENVKEQAIKSDERTSWKNLDLAKLEAEIFTLGIWKDYDQLERNLSMPELVATMSAIRELSYQEKKFMAAIQGVDIDSQSGETKGQKEWEDLKARVFSKGATEDSNDVLALQGANAQKVGFGIGMGLDYEDLKDPSVML